VFVQVAIEDVGVFFEMHYL